MTRSLPPLNYLQPFEVTARLGSTVRAAAELGRTHGAVSRQIKQLERWLGVDLFCREGGRLMLTKTGQQYFELVNRALTLLGSATDTFIHRERENFAVLHCPSIFACRWLLVRLSRFFQKWPQHEIWVCEDSQPPDFCAGSYHFALAMEPPASADFDVTPLMGEVVFPVCSAALAVRIGSLPALASARLLHTSDPIGGWPEWFASVGFETGPEVGLRTADMAVVLEAAANGMGVTLARGALVAADLRLKRMVRPLQEERKLDVGYWLVKPKYGRISSAARAFINWIRDEAALYQAEMDQPRPNRTSAATRLRPVPVTRNGHHISLTAGGTAPIGRNGAAGGTTSLAMRQHERATISADRSLATAT